MIPLSLTSSELTLFGQLRFTGQRLPRARAFAVTYYTHGTSQGWRHCDCWGHGSLSIDSLASILEELSPQTKIPADATEFK